MAGPPGHGSTVELAAPATSVVVGPFVNSIVGLSSPAGTTAILEGKLQDAFAFAVKASE